MRLVDEFGRVLDAEFEVEATSDGVDIVLYSRSGKPRSGQGRNTEYFVVLERLLGTLANIGATIRIITVDSAVALQMPLQKRTIPLPYPLALSKDTDPAALRIRITEQQRTVASKVADGRPGGNKHKRIRISVDLTGSGVLAADLPLVLNADATTFSLASVGRRYTKARQNPSVRPADVFTYDTSTRERALAAHAGVQNGLAEFLQQHDLEARSPSPHEPDFDIAWMADGVVVVGEVKSLAGTEPVQQLRLGLGQVVQYRRQLADLYGEAAAVLAVEHEPPSSWRDVCADVGVLLAWPPAWAGLVGAVLQTVTGTGGIQAGTAPSD